MSDDLVPHEEHDWVTREVAIEDCVTDIVEMMWDNLTSDNELIEEKIEDLAAQLGIEVEGGYKMNIDVEKYAELQQKVIRTAWMGLISKLGENLFTIHQQDLIGDHA